MQLTSSTTQCVPRVSFDIISSVSHKVNTFFIFLYIFFSHCFYTTIYCIYILIHIPFIAYVLFSFMHYYTGLSYSIFSISFMTGLFSYRYLSIIESFIYAVIVCPISDAANNDVRARSSHTMTIPLIKPTAKPAIRFTVPITGTLSIFLMM